MPAKRGSGSSRSHSSTRPRTPRRRGTGADPFADVLRQLDAIERGDGAGELQLPDGVTLDVTSLAKPYFPDDGITKGDLMRFYVRVAPVLLDAVADRPLVLRRYPAGIDGPSFHQHDPGDNTPDGVRVEQVVVERGSPPERRLVGGDPTESPGVALATLLYTVQLGTIPVNVWHSRVGSIATPDYAALDLDPDPKAGFAGVIAVARAVHEALARRRLQSAAKTSGSRGIHMLIPLPDGSSYDAAAALAEEVAAEVAAEYPKRATVERSLDARPRGSVYVDHMQNAAGKTLAAVFSVRARPKATVSTPITWRQVTRTLQPERYTIRTVTRQRAALMARWRSAMG
jgi:bifunctional non-homologous end joining protein LigD